MQGRNGHRPAAGEPFSPRTGLDDGQLGPLSAEDRDVPRLGPRQLPAETEDLGRGRLESPVFEDCPGALQERGYLFAAPVGLHDHVAQRFLGALSFRGVPAQAHKRERRAVLLADQGAGQFVRDCPAVLGDKAGLDHPRLAGFPNIQHRFLDAREVLHRVVIRTGHPGDLLVGIAGNLVQRPVPSEEAALSVEKDDNLLKGVQGPHGDCLLPLERFIGPLRFGQVPDSHDVAGTAPGHDLGRRNGDGDRRSVASHVFELHRVARKQSRHGALDVVPATGRDQFPGGHASQFVRRIAEQPAGGFVGLLDAAVHRLHEERLRRVVEQRAVESLAFLQYLARPPQLVLLHGALQRLDEPGLHAVALDDVAARAVPDGPAGHLLVAHGGDHDNRGVVPPRGYLLEQFQSGPVGEQVAQRYQVEGARSQKSPRLAKVRSLLHLGREPLREKPLDSFRVGGVVVHHQDPGVLEAGHGKLRECCAGSSKFECVMVAAAFQ